MTDDSLIVKGLRERTTVIRVVDCDHYRIRGGLAVETDYILCIQSNNSSSNQSYRISKTFHSFRRLCEQLKPFSETNTFCTLIEGQKASYFGKVNVLYVTLLAKSRREILQNALNLVVHDFATYPDTLVRIFEVFFLTDVVQEDGYNEEFDPQTQQQPNTSQPPPPITPMSTRIRKSQIDRQLEHDILHDCKDTLFLENDETRTTPRYLPNYQSPEPTVWIHRTRFGVILDTNPFLFMAIMIVCCRFLLSASMLVVHIDLDIFLLIVFACFCLGLHCPRPLVGGFDRPAVVKAAIPSDALLKRSMLLSPRRSINKKEDNRLSVRPTPPTLTTLPKFPKDARIGTVPNCWSKPDSTSFMVRGPTYLHDHQKVPSQDYLFEPRGLDLFLTDDAPANVGRNQYLLAGKLRELPTCIINFRLPWGVLLLYAEIPADFLPFLQDRRRDIPPTFTPAQRTLARWLQHSPQERNNLLKIVPSVVDGPWVVKSVVGGKPALIGQKLPISYVYQPAQESDTTSKKKCPYLELDLDIAASSAARGILSVTRSYTNILTLNLGFVIQGCEDLPEQMLMGVTLHSIDPLTAAPLPQDDSMPTLPAAPMSSDDESV